MKVDVEEVKSDFAPFADPATLLECNEREVVWTQNGKQRRLRFKNSGNPRLPCLLSDGREYKYLEYFAGTEMADLRRLAETQTRLAADEIYVDSWLEIGEQRNLATLSLLELCESDVRRTRLLFVEADAGVGKTTLLRHLTTHGARKYLDGQSTKLFLYVDAQNRALSRLDEAVALVLQDMRAPFTYHAVATLARLGLVVPIIDGFDELLGVGGYEDALSSLIRFLSRLRGQGIVITSARSSFYRFQNVGWLAKNKSVDALDFEVTVARLLHWDDSQLGQFVARSQELFNHGAHFDLLATLRDKSLTESWGLLRVPFFVALFVDVVRGIVAELRERKTTMVDEVVQNLRIAIREMARDGAGFFARELIRRELGKVTRKDDSPLLSQESHERFLAEVAEEMWMQEARSLDKESVVSIMELIIEDDPGAREYAGVIRERALVHPMFSPNATTGISFRHELLFSYYVAGVIVRGMDGDSYSFSRMYTRGRVTSEIADAICLVARAAPSVSRDRGVASIVEKLSPERLLPGGRDIARKNTGAIVARLSRLGLPSGLVVSGATFEDSVMSNTNVNGVVFSDCDFVRVDLRGAKWKDVDLTHSRMLQVSVSGETELTGTRLPPISSISGLSFDGERMFAPADIVACLQQLGALPFEKPAPPQEMSAKVKKRLVLLQRFVRCVERVYRYSQNDLENAGIVHDENWEYLRALLYQNDLIKAEKISRRGTTGEVYRLAVDPSYLEFGSPLGKADERLGSFWKSLLDE